MAYAKEGRRKQRGGDKMTSIDFRFGLRLHCPTSLDPIQKCSFSLEFTLYLSEQCRYKTVPDSRYKVVPDHFI